MGLVRLTAGPARLKAGNAQIIAVGEAYESKASALNGIEPVKRNAPDATIDDQTS